MSFQVFSLLINELPMITLRPGFFFLVAFKWELTVGSVRAHSLTMIVQATLSSICPASSVLLPAVFSFLHGKTTAFFKFVGKVVQSAELHLSFALLKWAVKGANIAKPRQNTVYFLPWMLFLYPLILLLYFCNQPSNSEILLSATCNMWC